MMELATIPEIEGLDIKAAVDAAVGELLQRVASLEGGQYWGFDTDLGAKEELHAEIGEIIVRHLRIKPCEKCGGATELPIAVCGCLMMISGETTSLDMSFK